MTQPQVHILVVDDERNIRKNLGMVLEEEGYKVDTTGTGDDALLRIKAGHYDLVFIDIQMPKMDGLELLRYLRGLRPKMPVVMLTAYAEPDLLFAAMQVGAAGYLLKHTPAAELVATRLQALSEAQPDLPIVFDPVMVATSGAELADEVNERVERRHHRERGQHLGPARLEQEVELVRVPGADAERVEREVALVVRRGRLGVLVAERLVDGQFMHLECGEAGGRHLQSARISEFHGEPSSVG